MTEATSTRRRRREPGAADNIPAAVTAWFAGEGPLPWEALLPQQSEHMPAWWLAWSAQHPGAKPPAGAPWLKWGTA